MQNNEHTFIRLALRDGARTGARRAIDATVYAAGSHVEIAARSVNMDGDEVAIVRVEHRNAAVVAHVWDADGMGANDEPQTIHLIDAARVKTKRKGKQRWTSIPPSS